MTWTGSIFMYGSILLTFYLVWYAGWGRKLSGVGEPRPKLAKASEDFVKFVGFFFLINLVLALINRQPMPPGEIIGASLLFVLSDYLKQLTLFLKGRKATGTNTGQA